MSISRAANCDYIEHQKILGNDECYNEEEWEAMIENSKKILTEYLRTGVLLDTIRGKQK